MEPSHAFGRDAVPAGLDLVIVVYYDPRGETALNLDLMWLVDEQFLNIPFNGVRQMTWHLQNEGHAVNKKRIRRLMRLMPSMPF